MIFQSKYIFIEKIQIIYNVSPALQKIKGTFQISIKSPVNGWNSSLFSNSSYNGCESNTDSSCSKSLSCYWQLDVS